MHTPNYSYYLLLFLGFKSMLPYVSFESQTQVMCDLISSTNINVKVRYGWSCGSNSSMCSWPGIGCDDCGRLKTIVINGLGVSGTLPSSLGYLTDLSVFNVIDNSLGSTVPTTLGLLSEMVSLGLSSNKFVGSVPTSLVNLTQLSLLFLSNNSFKGSLPKRLCDIPINDFRSSFAICKGLPYTLQYWNTSMYRQYVVDRAVAMNWTDGIYFSTFDFQKLVVDGSCRNWNSFVAGSLALPSDEYSFSYLSVSLAYQKLPKSAVHTLRANCTNSTAVSLLGYYMNYIASSSIISPRYEVSCDGNIWQVFRCNTSVALCLDCNWNCSCPGVSFVANPCGVTRCDENTGSYSVALFGIATKDYAPACKAFVLNVTRMTIELSVNLSSPGIVYCAPLRSGVSLSSTNYLKQIARPIYIDHSDSPETITLANLAPSTTYDIYCYTEDLLGHAMDISTVISSKLEATTSCCPGITFTTIYPVINNQTSSSGYQVFFFILNAPPVNTTVVNIVGTPCNGVNASSEMTAVAVPPSFVIPRGSQSLYGSFIILGVPGCYQFTAYSVLGSKLDNSTITVNVVANASIPAPRPISARFSDDGLHILVKFDLPTDYGQTVLGSSYASVYSCDRLLHFTGSATSSCVWTANQLITITLNSTAPWPVVGDEIIMSCGAVELPFAPGMCRSAQYSVIIGSPLNAYAPAVGISMVSMLGTNQDLLIDPTASTGHGGRPWNLVMWNVTAAWNTSGAIADYLNENHKSTFFPITVPKSMLRLGTLTVTLTLQNFLLMSSATSKTVTIYPNPELPVVRITGLGQVLLYRYQSLNIFVLANVATYTNTSSRALTYSWKLYRGANYLPAMVSTSIDPRYFTLNPYTLDVYNSYKVVVVATATNGAFASDSASIVVKRSGVRAFIVGGVERHVSNLDTLVIDASQSSDLDYPETRLDFQWTCFTTSPVYGSDCGVVLINNATISFPPGSVRPASYNFSVVVKSYDGGSDVTSVLIVVRMIPTPYISIMNAGVYIPSARITMNATVGMKYITEVSWSTTFAGLNLSAIANTPLKLTFIPGVALVQLALKPYTLSAGVTYNFVLTAWYTTLNETGIGYARIAIPVNVPPWGGQLYVTPLQGVALETFFFINTFGWVDDVTDYPLVYYFTYTASNAQNPLVLKNKNQVQYVHALLGPGLSGAGYIVTISACAENTHGAVSYLKADVQVLPTSSVVAMTYDMTLNLRVAAETFDTDLTTQVVDAVVLSLNKVNCTLAVDCNSLHRENCAFTAQTCGPCKTGYLGIIGDANSYCTEVPKSTGSSCNSSRECLSQLCEENICVKTPKICPNNCSAAGICLFYDANNLQTAFCDSTDVSCKARCQCNSGKYGRDCSLSYLSYATSQAMRGSLCQSLNNANQVQVCLIYTTLYFFLFVLIASLLWLGGDRCRNSRTGFISYFLIIG